jgi:DNA repair photolyase
MQSEQDWAERIDVDDEHGAAERYRYFMRPEPREDMGPIYTESDPYMGADTKCRDMTIGMTRNAAEENKKRVKVYLLPFPHTRIDNAKPLQGWYKSLHEPVGVRNRPCFTEAVLTEPYGGFCAVGCAFCYVNSGFRGYRGTGLITVPLNYGDQIAKQLRTMRRAAAGYFSSFTDPFTPLEQYYHNTQRAAEEFVKVGLPIFFLSRLRYPLWAINLLRQNPHSYAQKSINTSDREDWRKLSPGALSYEGHLADIRRLRRAGIYVSIQCNPIIPGVTRHAHILRLFAELADAGANHVIVKFVEAGYSWAPAMVERMIRRFGDRGRAFADLFTDNQGGQRCVEEGYRLRAHQLYSTAARRLGLTYATCYEYKYERDTDGNITNKTGVSIGREFTTAAQCHGPAVPMYSRRSADADFAPVDECPPSGCLHCAAENEEAPGQPRCGDELAGQATALRLADLRVPIGQGKGRRMELPLASPQKEGGCEA